MGSKIHGKIRSRNPQGSSLLLRRLSWRLLLRRWKQAYWLLPFIWAISATWRWCTYCMGNSFSFIYTYPGFGGDARLPRAQLHGFQRLTDAIRMSSISHRHSLISTVFSCLLASLTFVGRDATWSFSPSLCVNTSKTRW